jgi:serine/threonine protein phosphatase PrpC
MTIISSSPSISVYAETNRGRRRENNEDSYSVVQLRSPSLVATLVVVADGVGGLEAGELASELASLTFSSSLINWLIETKIRNVKITEVDLANFIYRSVNDANDKIRKAVNNAGTTLVASLMIPIGEQVLTYIINVGDSRAYLIDREKWEIYQLTRDHSLAWMDFEEKELKRFWNELVLINNKDMLAALARAKFNYIKMHPKAHVITNVVGYYGEVDDIEIIRINLVRDDWLLLCTDGLTDMLNDYEILNVIKGSENPVNDLIERANLAGGNDNITVALIKID